MRPGALPSPGMEMLQRQLLMEREQSIRAGRLAELGYAAAVPESSLSREALREAMAAALTLPRRPSFLRLDGATATAAILDARLSAARSA